MNNCGCLNSPKDHEESEITKHFMQNTLCAELCGQIDEWNADPVQGVEFWFHTVLKTKGFLHVIVLSLV